MRVKVSAKLYNSLKALADETGEAAESNGQSFRQKITKNIVDESDSSKLSPLVFSS